VRAAQQRFDVILVEGSAAEVTSLLRETRLSRKNDGTLAMAVVPSQEIIRELFSLGVNFVLYKPVAYDRALSSLRAARAVMRKEKRKDVRAAVHAHATIDYANVQQDKATLVDLGHNGMAMLFGKKMPPTSKVYFQFKLPGQSASIRLSGQVVWQDWNGRGGVQFVDVPKTSRRLLEEFLSANVSKIETHELAEVTVEMEEPLQAVAVAVAEPKRAAVAEPSPVREDKQQSVLEAEARVAAAQAEMDANNRRVQTRYSCRLGAEVYRTGVSVRHYCCLTDLSAGGCYLEMPLPFPQGSGIEIVVRTYEMKLHLRGTVLTSHPGYGMGIGFELKTKEEQANVAKLTEFVASTITS
jgi:c-di-GMP-binding flagellar brake protein YcgR